MIGVMDAQPGQPKPVVSMTPPGQQDALPFVRKTEPKTGAKKPPHRVNLWLTDSLYVRLADEAEKHDMTTGAWVQHVLVNRPERVVEVKVLSKERRSELDRIPVLEKQLAGYAALKKDYASVVSRRDALKKELEGYKAVFMVPHSVKCKCGKEVVFDFSDEVDVIK
jgi:hypothetical protein